MTSSPGLALFYNAGVRVMVQQELAFLCDWALSDDWDEKPAGSVRSLWRKVTNAIATVSRATSKEEFAFAVNPVDSSLLVAASELVDPDVFRTFVQKIWGKLYRFPQSTASDELQKFKVEIFQLVVEHGLQRLKSSIEHDIFKDAILTGANDALSSIRECLEASDVNGEDLWKAISQLGNDTKQLFEDEDKKERLRSKRPRKGTAGRLLLISCNP